MRVPGSALCLGFAVFAAGCLPDRDNLHDPSGAPVAALEVHGASGSAGTRLDSFTLDASASHDPKHRGRLHYEWDRGDGVFVTAGAGTSATFTTTIPVTAEDFPLGFGAAQRKVRVRVRAGDGHKAIAMADAFVTNLPPHVDAGPDLFVPPFTSPTVVLDACAAFDVAECSSSDPDGDALSYTWTQLRGTPVDIADRFARRTTFSAPPLPETLVFRVDGTDELAVSSAVVRVFVGSSILASSGAGAVHVVPEARSVAFETSPTGATALSSVAVDPDTHDVWQVVLDSDGPDGLIRFPPRLAGPGVQFATTSSIGRIAASGGSLCATSNSADRFLHLDPAGFLSEYQEPVDFATGIASGPGGDCWATTTKDLKRLGPDGLVTVAADVFELAVDAVPLGARGLAVLDAISYPDPIVLAIHVVDSSGTISPPIVIGDQYGLVVLSPDGEGLLMNDQSTQQLLRVRDCDGVACFEPTHVPVSNPTALLSDPVERSVWVFGSLGSTARRYRMQDGELLPDATLNLSEVVGVGSLHNGAALDQSTGDLYASTYRDDLSYTYDLVFTPSHAVRTEPLSFDWGTLGQQQRPRLEPTRGSVWYALLQTVQNAGLDGRVRRSVSFGGQNTATYVYGLSPDSDGGVWVGYVDSALGYHIAKIGPDGDVLLDEPSLAGANSLEGDSSYGHLCVASASAAQRLALPQLAPTALAPPPTDSYLADISPDGACWFGWYDGVYRVGATETSGISTAFDFNETPRDLAADPFDGSMWAVSTSSIGFSSTVVYRVDADGDRTRFSGPGFFADQIAAVPTCAVPGPGCLEIWIGADDGLYKCAPEVDPATNRLRVIEFFAIGDHPLFLEASPAPRGQ